MKSRKPRRMVPKKLSTEQEVIIEFIFLLWPQYSYDAPAIDVINSARKLAADFFDATNTSITKYPYGEL